MNIQTVNHKDISFISVTNPGNLEVKYLKSNFGFDTLHLDDYINKIQTPKIETFKNYSLIVLDFPLFSQNVNGVKEHEKGNPLIDSLLRLPKATLSSVPLPQFSTQEKRKRIIGGQVDFFIGKDYLVVLHDGILSPINNIFSLCQQTLRHRNEFMGEGPVFLSYRLIDALVDSCFPVMNELSSAIDSIDKNLDSTQYQKRIEDISTTRRNIVFFQTMIKPIIPLFRQLEEGKFKELNGTMQPFWGNILDHLSKIWERLEDNRELIEGISLSNESLLSFRNNEIVKFLTIITSISFPFIIVNNLYSMNIVGLPWAQHPGIVWVLFSLIFMAGLVIIVYFKFRKWI
ncbi:MAG: CorA family divalent cation transporter [Candidatus Levybacteria bacterium]|nr:CorA family divalent cation transporter [Candidatus Levybacteria bacterium]